MLKHLFIEAAPGPFGDQKHMLIMHGRGDVKESFIPITKEINVTGLSYSLLDAPHSYMFGHSWYPLPPTSPHEQIAQAIDLVEDYIKTLKRPYEDIFIAGFSQGGAIAIEMALQTQHPFAGVVALSPRIFLRPELEEKAKTFKRPIFIAHGEYDEMIPYAETKNGVDKLKALGPNLEFKSYPMGHEIDIMTILDLRQWLNQQL